MMIHSKWKQDLIRDIRTNTQYDDVDAPPYTASYIEVTECNLNTVEQKFLSIKDKCTAILEIGVNRNGVGSITQKFLGNKLDSTIYIGIDLDDKSYLNNSNKNVYTIQADSSNYQENIQKIKSYGVEKLDFIFIDGWHSINQVMKDWEYTRILSDYGIVGFHDVTAHPGPERFIKALNKEIWDVEENLCCNDWGVGFATKKL